MRKQGRAPDGLWGVCLIERVENPAVLSQHRSIRQGDATGVSPSSWSVVVGGANRKVMHEGAVRVMAEGAIGRTPIEVLSKAEGAHWVIPNQNQCASTPKHITEREHTVKCDLRQRKHTQGDRRSEQGTEARDHPEE